MSLRQRQEIQTLLRSQRLGTCEVHEATQLSSSMKKKTVKSKVSAFDVWDSPRVKAILERPEGTPIDLSTLTEEERDALAREAQGMWADHPEITDSAQWVRELWTGPSNGPADNL